MIDIDEVEARGHLANAHLARPRLADLDLFPFEDFRAPGLVNSDRVRHCPRLRRAARKEKPRRGNAGRGSPFFSR